jgi:hypothetical protein
LKERRKEEKQAGSVADAESSCGFPDEEICVKVGELAQRE